MRLLFVVHQFFPEFGGGTERVALNLARMAQRAGHSVQVLACMLEPARHPARPAPRLDGAYVAVVEGVPVTLLDRAGLPADADHALSVAPAWVDKLEAWMQAERFDVAHVLHTMRMATAVAAVQRAGLPMVFTVTDFFAACYRVNMIDAQGEACTGPAAGARCGQACPTFHWTPAALKARHQQAASILGYAAARVAPSEFVAQRLREAFRPLKFDVIEHGIDLLSFGVPRARSPKDDHVLLGFVGTLIPAKGLHVLLHALAAVPAAKLRLQVAGDFHGDPAYANEVRRLADADSRVELLGPRSAQQIAELMHRIDLLCLPSLVPESFALVVQEAAAAGVPSLVSDLGAQGMRLRAGNAGGGVVAPGDVDAWARALAEFAARPEVRRRWRSEVRLPQRIEEEASLYEGIYRSSAM